MSTFWVSLQISIIFSLRQSRWCYWAFKATCNTYETLATRNTLHAFHIPSMLKNTHRVCNVHMATELGANHPGQLVSICAARRAWPSPFVHLAIWGAPSVLTRPKLNLLAYFNKYPPTKTPVGIYYFVSALQAMVRHQVFAWNLGFCFFKFVAWSRGSKYSSCAEKGVQWFGLNSATFPLYRSNCSFYCKFKYKNIT